MSQRVFLGGGPEVLLVFLACLGGVRALLDRGLDPPASICRGACFACVLRVFCESE